MEGDKVAGLGGVIAAHGPLPFQLVWLIRERGVLDSMPELDVLPDLVNAKFPLDVPCPSVCVQILGDSGAHPSALGDAAV
jgi:hypothetical protein